MPAYRGTCLTCKADVTSDVATKSGTVECGNCEENVVVTKVC